MSDRIDIPLFPASHDHPHGHVQDGHDYKAENEKFFDKNAKEMDAREDVQDVAKRVGVALREAFPSLFNKESTTVMDYACGTGTLLFVHDRDCRLTFFCEGHVSRVLFPYVKSILGVDISQGVVRIKFIRARSANGITAVGGSLQCPRGGTRRFREHESRPRRAERRWLRTRWSQVRRDRSTFL